MACFPSTAALWIGLFKSYVEKLIFTQNKRSATVGYQCNRRLIWPTLKAHKTNFIYG